MVATVGDTEITADSLLYWLAATVDGTAQYYAMMGMSASDLPWDTERWRTAPPWRRAF